MLKDMFSLEGKKGFITGAAQGIGKCLAGAFAEFGADVAIVDLNFDAAEKTAKEIVEKTGRNIKAYRCNVTDPDDVDKMIADFAADYGELNFAVNNAGICAFDPVLDVSPKDHEAVIGVNLNGVFYTARAAARRMKEQGTGGSVVNTCSASAHVINQPQTIASYCASKAGVLQLTKALAVETAQYGVRVNCVSPGYIQTELIAQMQDYIPIWQGQMPKGSRLGYPEDLIGAYVYFASDASKFATGSDLRVDGGYTLL